MRNQSKPYLRRIIQMSDTYFVLMEPDDLKPWHDGMLPPTSENPKLKVHKDDLSDFVFLFDSETSWKRVEKDQIQIQNRSRKLRLEFKKESQALQVILCFQAIKDSFKNLRSTLSYHMASCF